VHYVPVHHQPYYRHLHGGLDLPGADAYYARCVSIPMFPAMSDADVRAVVDGIVALAVRKVS
jgi:dTDP-4-amino-4,6-dideoxygalactose transaminase